MYVDPFMAGGVRNLLGEVGLFVGFVIHMKIKKKKEGA